MLAGWLLLIGACGGGDSPGPGTAADAAEEVADAAPLRLADINVTVHYTGKLEGTLIVGAFLEFPVMSGPLAFVSIDTPTFPAVVRLRDLEPNTYYAVAVLDVEPASPTVPGPEDLLVGSDALTTNGVDDVAVEVTIQ